MPRLAKASPSARSTLRAIHRLARKPHFLPQLLDDSIWRACGILPNTASAVKALLIELPSSCRRMPESDHNSKVALSTRGARAVHKTRHLSYSRFHYSHYRKCQNLTFKGGRWKDGKVETRTFLCQKRWRNLSAKRWRLGTTKPPAKSFVKVSAF